MTDYILIIGNATLITGHPKPYFTNLASVQEKAELFGDAAKIFQLYPNNIQEPDYEENLPPDENYLVLIERMRCPPVRLCQTAKDVKKTSEIYPGLKFSVRKMVLLNPESIDDSVGKSVESRPFV